MLKVEAAKQIILQNSRLLGIEEIEILDSLDRVLAEDIISEINLARMIIPPWTVMRLSLLI